MTNSSGEPTRVELAPPRESPGRLHRTGYLALTAAGLLVCTAFAAVAQVAAPEEDTGDHRAAPTDGLTDDNRSGGGGPELIPGQAVPADTTVVVDGVPVTGTLPSSTDAPTTVVRVGDDGRQTTSVVPPPPQDEDSGSVDHSETSSTSNRGPHHPTDSVPTGTTEPTDTTQTDTESTEPSGDESEETTTTGSDPGDGDGDGNGDATEQEGGGSSSPAAATSSGATTGGGTETETVTGTVATRTPNTTGTTGTTTVPTGDTGTGTDRPSR